jgi:hypothetical protein
MLRKAVITLSEDITQIYDKIFKRILTLSNSAVINFINAIFSKNFPADSEIIYNWTENIKDDLHKTIADTVMTINGTEKFNIEVQINNDSEIVLRVFEYGYQAALKHKIIERDRIILNFPTPKIIFLEDNSQTPDSVKLILNFQEQGQAEYNVPAIKFLSYTIEELNNQRMIILMPLYLLKLRKEIQAAKSKGTLKESASALKNLLNNGIIKSIRDNEQSGNITSEDAFVLREMLDRLYKYLYGDIKEFEEEGVGAMLEEKLIFDAEIKIYEAKKEADKEAEKKVEKSEKKVEKAEKEAKQRMIDAIKRLLTKGMAPDDIAEAMQYPMEEVLKLRA